MGACRKGTHAKFPEEMTNAVFRKEAGVIKKTSGIEVVIEQQENIWLQRIPDIRNI